jgi:predicted nuclease of predicted toxin-antitoxin system
LERAKREDRIHVTKDQDWFPRRSLTWEAGEDVVTSFLIWNHLKLAAQLRAFLPDDFSDAVHGGFVVRRGFGLDESFQQVAH